MTTTRAVLRSVGFTVAAWVWTVLMLVIGAAGGLIAGLLTCGAC